MAAEQIATVNLLSGNRLHVSVRVGWGTNGADNALKRVVKDADGWMPLIIPGLDPVDVGSAVVKLRQLPKTPGVTPRRCRSGVE